MRKHRWIAVTVWGTVLAVAVLICPAPSTTQGGPGTAWASSRRDQSRRRFRQEQSQLRKARKLVERISRNRRSTPELRAKAAQLAELLKERERYLASIEERRRQFLATYRSEFEELKQLQARITEIKESLSEARQRVLSQSQGDIDHLLSTSAEAKKLAEELRKDYQANRRARHRR